MCVVKVVIVVVLVLFTASCADEKTAAPQKQPRSEAKVTPAVETLPSPAGAGAAEPFLFATNDGVLLSWLEPVSGTDRTALRFARYRAGQWTEPRTIVERNG